MDFRDTRKSDVDVYASGADAAPFVTEVKTKARGEEFVMLERWLGENYELLLVWDRAAPLLVLPWARRAEVFGKGADD